MGLIGVDRLAQGTGGSSGGAGGTGDSSMDTVIQNLAVGANDVPHTLGLEPTDWAIKDSIGRPIVFEAVPKPGAETTILLVTTFTALNAARITVYAKTP